MRKCSDDDVILIRDCVLKVAKQTTAEAGRMPKQEREISGNDTVQYDLPLERVILALQELPHGAGNALVRVLLAYMTLIKKLFGLQLALCETIQQDFSQDLETLQNTASLLPRLGDLVGYSKPSP